MKTIYPLTLLAVFIIAIIAGCVSPQPTPTPPEQQPQTPTPTPMPTPRPTSLPDLKITNVRVENLNDPTAFDHNLIATIKNDGDDVASGFNAGCEWSCPGGLTTSGGASIVQGGYISRHSEFTYHSPMQLFCEGHPTILYFRCSINEEGRVKETDTSNNYWSGQVNIP